MSATSCARWIRAAAGGDVAMVRISVPDATGRLRVIATEGEHNGSGRLRSTRRRTVFRTLRATRMPIGPAALLSLGIFPLVDEGDPLGVVEVLAPTGTLVEREQVLVAVVEQSALVLSNARTRAKAEDTLAGMRAMLRLASELLSARTAAEAVRVTADVCFESLDAPIAGLLPDRDGWGWYLAASGGLGTRKRSELRTALRDARGLPERRRADLPALRARFREVTGGRDVVARPADGAVLLLADVPRGHEEFLDRAAALLETVLIKRGLGRLRRSADRAEDLGIAWTAHELKGPLVGARAALERASVTEHVSEGQEWLRRTKDELQQLVDLIDPLLRWSTGAEALTPERTDLVRIVAEAIASCSLEWGPARVVVESPDHLFVAADPHQLRSAVANVVRNALAYSPPETPVAVRVESQSRAARVVVRDRGPGIAAGERELVFDPLARGRAGRLSRNGSGLGLFITRRVLEAHGGSISLRPSRSGATFVLELPLLHEGRELSAS